MPQLPPGKRPGYVPPPKVAGAVSVNASEARALATLMEAILAGSRQISPPVLRMCAAVAGRARRSLDGAKVRRAEFERARARR